MIVCPSESSQPPMSELPYRCLKQLMQCGTPTVNSQQVRRQHPHGNISPLTKALHSSCLPTCPRATNSASKSSRFMTIIRTSTYLVSPQQSWSLTQPQEPQKHSWTAASLTAIRTGAGGGVAADLLARKDATTVGLFGAGVQARAQLQAVMVVRNITCVNLISRTHASAQQLATEISAWTVTDAPEVNLVSTPRQVVEDADIVLCATTSGTPLFDGNDLQPGTHITAVGTFVPEKREVDTTTIRRAHRIVVDSREDCLEEAGDLIIPNAEIDAEIGEIINGNKPGRESDEEITFFKSVGVAVQDAVAGAAVLTEAEAKGLGTLVEMVR